MAVAIIRAARSSAASSGRQRSDGAASQAGSAWKASASKPWVAWQMSSGTSTITGPGRPEVATRKARRVSSGMRCTASMRRNFLAGRPQDLDLAGLLRHVLAGVVAMRVADQHHQRRAGIQRFHQAGDEVGGARPERGIRQADAAGHFRVGVGDEHGGALVVDQMVRQAEPAGGVVERQQLKTAHAEHGAAIERLDHAGERLAAGHFVGHRPTIPRTAATIAGAVTRTASSSVGA